MKKFLLILLILIGLVLIAATIISLLVSTRMTVGNMFPGTAGVVVAAYGIIALVRKKPLFGNRVLRIIVTVGVCLFVALFVVVEALIIFGADVQQREEPPNFVVVPGAGIFPDGRLTLTLQYRLDAAADYLEEKRNALCIVSGGRGGDEPVTEAQAMKEYLMEQGIASMRIIMEDRAVSTYENMQGAAAIMDARFPDMDKTAAVVTSDFHVYRALVLARRAGIDAFGVGARTPGIVIVPNYMREFLAVVNTWLFGVEI